MCVCTPTLLQPEPLGPRATSWALPLSVSHPTSRFRQRSRYPVRFASALSGSNLFFSDTTRNTPSSPCGLDLSAAVPCLAPLRPLLKVSARRSGCAVISLPFRSSTPTFARERMCLTSASTWAMSLHTTVHRTMSVRHAASRL
eukprot:2637134-Rhodomonas_salina.1